MLRVCCLLALAGWPGLLSAVPRADDSDAGPRTATEFITALDRRRAEAGPLEGCMRVFVPSGNDEDAAETLLPFRWEPEAGLRFEANSTVVLPAALRGLELPLLRPDGMTIHAFRRRVSPSLPSARPAGRSGWLLPPSVSCRVVGPDPVWPSAPRLSDEFDLAAPAILLTLSSVGGPLEIVVDPKTLHVQQITWTDGGGRAAAVVEGVRPASRATASGEASSGRPVGGAAAAREDRPGVGSAARPDASPVRGVLRWVARSSSDPSRPVLDVEGAARLPEGAAVEIRCVTKGEDLAQGAWEREEARGVCVVRDGMFRVELTLDALAPVAGRTEVCARPAGGDEIDGGALVAPAEVWRRELQVESRAAEHVLQALADGRAIDAETLAAFAGAAPWVVLPATRRAIESILQARAGAAIPAPRGARPSAGAGDNAPPADASPPRPDAGLDRLRDLLARETRWAALRRLCDVDPAARAREAEAVRRALGDLPAASGDVDAALGSLLDDAGRGVLSPETLAGVRTRLRDGAVAVVSPPAAR